MHNKKHMSRATVKGVAGQNSAEAPAASDDHVVDRVDQPQQVLPVRVNVSGLKTCDDPSANGITTD